MRTTVNIDPDNERVIADLRKKEGLGMSEAVNKLLRRGAVSASSDYAFPDTSFNMGAKTSVAKTGELLDHLDEEDRS